MLNQAEIEYANSRQHNCHNVRKGVRLLYNLMQSVNAQSDGWAYWVPPRKASEKLVALLQTAGNLTHGTHGTITEAQLKKAITPIRSMVTRQTEKQKRFGNTFAFNVDEALKS